MRKVSNKAVHEICGELGFTHYENLINLHLLLGRGRFRFIGLPLKIRGGTGSPVRAVAVFEAIRKVWMLPITATDGWRSAHPGAFFGLLEISGVE